ncbi:Tyrosine phosphatase [Ceratobasidium theobromae]|uniref:protein-tyrosine-phosphatase n=1 Tax=Ceratobasidium theobromae TaxID=1582974 RepID=A0A5N5QE52_9AGAM|nr:Tyrosine phosphatase [Ceratobasidium theobromae]
MDFFAPDPSRVEVSAAAGEDPFAAAIGRRFSGPPMLTARLAVENGGARERIPTTQDTRFTAVAPRDLAAYLAHGPALVVDVRSSGAHALSHVRGALSLSVPSTLLKRPNFSLDKLATMIASTAAQSAFCEWVRAPRILVYDADLVRLVDGCGVLGLLRKFDAAGFRGDLGWVVGGHNAVARLARDCLDAGGPRCEPDAPNGFVHAHSLPQSAFQSRSICALRSPLTPVGSTTAAPGHRPTLQASNPFYDNIRQNRELSHVRLFRFSDPADSPQGITERIPLALGKHVIGRKDEIPVPWLREIVENSDKEKGIEALAMQFYRIELGEQRRLQGVMSHHSRESQIQSDDHKLGLDPFPFSITAGVEKGAKNRYKNIWPYEHARVRLHAATDDYVNASFVRPRGTNLQYIATQGPMPATFVDFWTSMVWEQNVHIIVMLTRQVEGNQLKCADYWSDREYGPLRLEPISIEGDEVVDHHTGFDFGLDSRVEDPQSTVRRTFSLRHVDHPDEPSRKIVQFQFLSWLDMNVPETPAGLLALVKSVREAADEAEKSNPSKAPSPVLVHCSAGVGRTGSFVAIDAILDGIRRDLESHQSTPSDLTPSDEPSDSDPDTGNPSSDSLNSSDPPRRPSFPESDVARKPGLGAATSMRPRRTSLRKTLKSRKSPPAKGHVNGNEIGNNSDPGAVAAPALDIETNPASISSSYSSASFRFSVVSPPATNTTVSVNGADYSGSGNSKLDGRPLAPAVLRATRAWSSEVANNVSKPDLVAPLPVPVSSSHLATPRPDSEMRNRDRDTFDYVFPRSIDRDKSVSPLGSMSEPIREVLEDMREQRMSLCQSLRQYVFVHRAVVEGVLAMVDEEKERAAMTGIGSKRHASPTELVKVNLAGHAARTKKRPASAIKDPMIVDS